MLSRLQDPPHKLQPPTPRARVPPSYLSLVCHQKLSWHVAGQHRQRQWQAADRVCWLQGVPHQGVLTGVTLRPHHQLLRLWVRGPGLLLLLLAACRCVLPQDAEPSDGGNSPAQCNTRSVSGLLLVFKGRFCASCPAAMRRPALTTPQPVDLPVVHREAGSVWVSCLAVHLDLEGQRVLGAGGIAPGIQCLHLWQRQ